ncbi:putative PX protein [Hordeum vulgare]|nr:putative PX protein [Hordeum vulgare]
MHERSSGPSQVAAMRLRSASLVLLLLALSLLAGWARFWWCGEDDEGCSLMGFRGDDSPATGGSVPVGGRRGLAPPPATAPVERSLSQSPRSPGAVARAPFLSICVTDPVKMGTGVQSYISYRVITKVIRLVLCSKSWISRFYDVETLAGVAWSLVPLTAENATLQANGTTRMLAAASAAL